MSIAMGRIRNKKIWLYFDRISDYAARCKNCKLNLSYKHTSANLVRHLYYKHHVDASYYGAERTGFLKHKRGRINQRSGVEIQVSSTLLPPVVNPNEVIKKDVPLKLVRCNRSDEEADDDEDTRSAHEYQEDPNALLSTFLNHKRGKINQRSDVEAPVSQFLPPAVTAADAFVPLGVIKQEIVPMELIRCNSSDEDVRSTYEYQKDPNALLSSSSAEAHEDISISSAMHSRDINVQEEVNVKMCMENPHLKEKLLAETRYYNEMAELARAKRIMIELQSRKLMLEMETMRSS